ncbi:succinate-semialdehyde dehydrogenase, mitochondrial-like, partial [Bidens hawaiensis]|uniref:succinate-semialdehyde dehydrogenase, mitochondrial-like n=1 Tax=Bidens hawaiensis TaxID=980011 RepID=UPI00404A8689
VYNPANGDAIASVACMGERETKDAISSAYNSFSHWRKLTAAERSTCLCKWYNLLTKHKEELGQLITLEHKEELGQLIPSMANKQHVNQNTEYSSYSCFSTQMHICDSQVLQVVTGASDIEFYAEEAKRVYGDILPSPLPDRRMFVLKQPVGVVGAITPWNFPLAMITRKVAPALACGCTVVIKPSELTPLSALAVAELALQSGIPPGVLNVVMEDASKIGNALLESPQVRKITFTGSTAVGKKLMAGAAETVKKVTLELGGNAPFIIFNDADLEAELSASLAAKFYNTGQTCISANRLLVQEGIYDKFINAFSNAVKSLNVGNGFSEGVTQGPLINEAAVQKVESLVQHAISQGAKVAVGGKRHNLGFTFYEPTLITDVKNEMLMARQEIFGPVMPVIRFKTEEEAIQIANDTESGLASYLFTNNIQRSWRVCEALEYGVVGVNEGLFVSQVAPFGGFKQSGLGRESSKYGLDKYLEIKCVCMGNMG